MKIEKIAQMRHYGNIDVIDIIRYIRSVPGKNDKVKILKIALHTNKNFSAVCKATYDKFYVYGIKKLDDIPAFKNTKLGTRQNALERFCELFLMGKLGKIGSCDAKMKLEFSKHMDRLSIAEAEVVPLILKRKLDAGFSSSSINKARPGFLPEFPVMLCDKANEKTLASMTYPAYAQLKMDALRGNIFIENGVVTTRSRNAKLINLHGVFEAAARELCPTGSFVIDGELIQVAGDGYESRRVSNGIGNKAIKGKIDKVDADKFVLVAWDIIPLEYWKTGLYPVPYETRFGTLEKRINATKQDKIRLVDSHVVANLAEAKKYYEACILQGEEGMILKKKSGFWKGKRSKDQLKFKVELEAEFVIIGVNEGAGKYSGVLGAFEIESADGIIECNVGTGLSDDQRSQYFTNNMIGKIVTVRFNEVIGNKFNKTKKSLFLPVFVEIREDKDKANTIDEIK